VQNMVYCFLCLWGVLLLQAQQRESTNIKAKKLFQEAKEVLRSGENDKALKLLHKALQFDKGFSDLYLLQAEIFNTKGERKS